MKTDLFVSVRRWDTGQLEELALSGRVQGIILGDPFCPQRMFEHGSWELPVLVQAAKVAGLRVAYQTPVYLTPRNYSENLDLILSLEQRGSLDFLLVQDVGLLNSLSESECRIPICWSLWGVSRGDTLSRDLLDFLLQLGVRYLETDKPTRVGPLQEYGIKVVYRQHAPKVATFGRVCYTQYVLGSSCNNRSLCIQKEPALAATEGRLSLKVSGYTLQHTHPLRNPCPEAVPDYVTVYLSKAAELPGVLADERD